MTPPEPWPFTEATTTFYKKYFFSKDPCLATVCPSSAWHIHVSNPGSQGSLFLNILCLPSHLTFYTSPHWHLFKYTHGAYICTSVPLHSQSKCLYSVGNLSMIVIQVDKATCHYVSFVFEHHWTPKRGCKNHKGIFISILRIWANQAHWKCSVLFKLHSVAFQCCPWPRNMSILYIPLSLLPGVLVVV
jgi:hypothetical protein